ncbi:hypothetical protein [Tropicimonas sp. IMCC6043]|uniref:hypothetical protein n=1 Tax=Tropicimonas sp. IMCC6043 TaxID=2510645 RepID=UPI00101DA755|nr:hypothetical protein [Tropicimonas sp. IMCC6043]RYH11263.1 hypothetical protein EU800_05215 [Tropicimonas sp. IMCC6043]
MDQDRILRNKLVRLSAAGRADTTGRLTSLPEAGLFVMVLRKVDDIVLARRLVLTAPDRPEFTCVVANRAVVAFGMADDALTDLDVHDTDGIAAFCARLKQFLDDLDEVTFRVEAPQREAQTISGGVTANFLARSCDEALYTVTEPDRPREVASFLERNGHRLTAWCQSLAGVIESGGKPSEFEPLQAFLDKMHEDLLNGDQKLVGGASGNFLFVISAAEAGSDSLFFSRHGDVQLAFAAPEDAVQALSADWRECCPA